VEDLIPLMKDPIPGVRAAAAWALGQTKDPRAIAPLAEAARDEDIKVRQSAVDALGDIQLLSAVGPLIDVAGDDTAYPTTMDFPPVVEHALTRYKDPRAVQLMIVSFKDKEEVPWTTGQALRTITGQKFEKPEQWQKWLEQHRQAVSGDK